MKIYLVAGFRTVWFALFALLLLPVSLLAGQFGNFTYEVIHDSEIRITHYDNVGGAVVIPDEIEGMPVTEIGDSAFAGQDPVGGGAGGGCEGPTAVFISESVRSIGDRAFLNCCRLNFITIPDSVTSIGEEAFRSCSFLTSIAISSGMASIGRGTFQGCFSLRSVTLATLRFPTAPALHSHSSRETLPI